MIIEKLRNINTTPTETLKLRLRERENFWIKKVKTYDTIRLKTRTELIPCYAVPAMLTLLSSICMWTENLTYISQLTSKNITSCCKSHS